MTTSQTKVQGLVFHLLYLAFFTSLVFSLRAISSITIGMMILAGLVLHRQAAKSLFNNPTHRSLLIACALFFVLQLAGLLYTENIIETWSRIRIKTGLILVPLAAMLTLPGILSQKRLLFQFTMLVAAASLYCIINALQVYQHTGDSSAFFYHDLVKPIGQHAVYFSLLVFIGLVFLLENGAGKELSLHKALQLILFIYLSAVLILLSSKLVIGFYLAYLVFYTARLIKRKNTGPAAGIMLAAVIALGASIVFATKNPVKDRFADILKGDLSLVTQENFDPGIYFNGLQFRLLQWRFVPEILNENKAWLVGMSPGDAQRALTQKYISKNMYTGDTSKEDEGYLAYNTHNQFLESLLHNGIAGLLFVFFICYALVRMAMSGRQSLPVFTIVLFMAWLFFESVFETQYGVIIFIFFPFFLSYRPIPGRAS